MVDVSPSLIFVILLHWQIYQDFFIRHEMTIFWPKCVISTQSLLYVYKMHEAFPIVVLRHKYDTSLYDTWYISTWYMIHLYMIHLRSNPVFSDEAAPFARNPLIVSNLMNKYLFKYPFKYSHRYPYKYSYTYP